MTAPTPSPVTDEICLIAAKSDYAFDGRGDWDKASRVDRERYIERCRQSLTAALDGMTVVPREPTEAMIDAACCCERGRTVEDALRAEYKAMISAATPQAQGE